ncbi:hypothetical protein MRX96_043263 [Rhipicephalus microplus]
MPMGHHLSVTAGGLEPKFSGTLMRKFGTELLLGARLTAHVGRGKKKGPMRNGKDFLGTELDQPCSPLKEKRRAHEFHQKNAVTEEYGKGPRKLDALLLKASDRCPGAEVVSPFSSAISGPVLK